MQLAEFLDSIEVESEPNAEISAELQALWWSKKGNWVKAHELAQDAGGQEGDWVHAYLHRQEGDLGNASYWYSRAGRSMPSEELGEEWHTMVLELIRK